jgi:hypothetical protein
MTRLEKCKDQLKLKSHDPQEMYLAFQEQMNNLHTYEEKIAFLKFFYELKAEQKLVLKK